MPKEAVLTESELSALVGPPDPAPPPPSPQAPPGTTCGCEAQGYDHRCIPAGNVWVHPTQWVPPGFENPTKETVNE